MKRQYRDTGGNTGHKTQNEVYCLINELICQKAQDGNAKQTKSYFFHYIFPVENQIFFIYYM